MAKAQRKQQAKTERRANNTPVSAGKFRYHKPGSQNRNKG